MLNLLLLSTAFAQEPNACTSETATAAYTKGFEAQRNRNTSEALKAYTECLSEEPNCMLCHYEIGWSYWSRSNWSMVEKHWTKVVELEPNNQEYKDRLLEVKNRKKSSSSVRVSRYEIQKECAFPWEQNGEKWDRDGTRCSFPKLQFQQNSGGDHYDELVYSPKSARIGRW